MSIRRNSLGESLFGLLGFRADSAYIASTSHAAALMAEHWAARDEAAPNEWAFVARVWPAAELSAMVEAVHRLSGHLGPRPVWVLVEDVLPRAVELPSDSVLDNPLGFASIADDELRLLDRDVAAGLRLARVGERWELEVWGEPWLSATTRALREVG